MKIDWQPYWLYPVREEQGLVVHPQIAEVVFIGESLKAPQLQVADQSSVRVGVEHHAALLTESVLATANLEAVEVNVLPGERNLKDLVKPGDACIATHQEASPDQRTDAAQHDAQLQHLLARTCPVHLQSLLCCTSHPQEMDALLLAREQPCRDQQPSNHP
ncbi:hypothetical protein QTI66_37265 [Variovorax sp. J22R133]|nr:hypothetical protein [Variovorax sp. J22R133]MDM0117752.1 hypothetical protein [Variovorax sp. J22R133]